MIAHDKEVKIAGLMPLSSVASALPLNTEYRLLNTEQRSGLCIANLPQPSPFRKQAFFRG